jgi:4-aminobutyrate aminotransferase/4-aminobutyrate aminotransferase/(S)-3-amino-2-methylpropionate transaminase
VGDVRAAGALIGIEFVRDEEHIVPAPAFQREVHRACVRRGVLGITQWGKWVYRLQPALTMPEDLFRWSCRAVVDAIAEVAADPPAEPPSLLERDAAAD